MSPYASPMSQAPSPHLPPPGSAQGRPQCAVNGWMGGPRISPQGAKPSGLEVGPCEERWAILEPNLVKGRRGAPLGKDFRVP